jgi:hypothetical protein
MAKVYICYTNEMRPSVAGVYLSKDRAKREIENPNNDFLKIEPEEFDVDTSFALTEEDIMNKSDIMIKLTADIDGTEVHEYGKIKFKHLMNKLTTDIIDSIMYSMNGDGIKL